MGRSEEKAGSGEGEQSVMIQDGGFAGAKAHFFFEAVTAREPLCVSESLCRDAERSCRENKPSWIGRERRMDQR